MQQYAKYKYCLKAFWCKQIQSKLGTKRISPIMKKGSFNILSVHLPFSGTHM